jgi:hypothetical protein
VRGLAIALRFDAMALDRETPVERPLGQIL